jgi:hypothetical protein
MLQMKWTPEKIAELKKRYPHEDNATLAPDLGCTVKALAFRASSLGIKKTNRANEARYDNMGRKKNEPESLARCPRRQIATGTLFYTGNGVTHLSSASAGRDGI